MAILTEAQIQNTLKTMKAAGLSKHELKTLEMALRAKIVSTEAPIFTGRYADEDRRAADLGLGVYPTPEAK